MNENLENEEELEEEWDADELEQRIGWMDAKSDKWEYQSYRAADDKSAVLFMTIKIQNLNKVIL